MQYEFKEADFITGFNDGYIITEHLPELSEKLSKVDSDVPRIDGFKEGRKQFVLDRAKEMREQWKTQDRGRDTKHGKTKDKGLDRD